MGVCAVEQHQLVQQPHIQLYGTFVNQVCHASMIHNVDMLLGLATVHLAVVIVILLKQQQPHLHLLWNAYMDLIASHMKIVGKVALAIPGKSFYQFSPNNIFSFSAFPYKSRLDLTFSKVVS